MVHIPNWRRRLFALGIVSVGLMGLSITAVSLQPAHAQPRERAAPSTSVIDWPSVARDAESLSPRLQAPQAPGHFTARHRAAAAKRLKSFTLKNGMLPLAHLGERVATLYPGVAAVPVPILLPLDTTRLLDQGDRALGPRRQGKPEFLNASIESLQVFPGLSGYDAVATISEALLRELGIAPSLKPQLHIAGSALSYGDDQYGEVVTDMQDLYPGIRRSLNMDEVTFAFRKYGAAYFINLACSNEQPVAERLACAQADAILRAVLRDLRLAGGGPSAIKRRAPAGGPQPRRRATVFKYYPPGNLMPGTSEMGAGGSPSRTVYGNNLLFPIKLAPAFANSQVFMHWGNCGGRKVDLPPQPGDQFPRYKCQQNDKELLRVEGHAENYAYPWRDNLCEERGRGSALECPVRKGHEGQDIRPSRCVPDPHNRERCSIDIFDVVAVTEGWAWWKTGDHENHLRLNADDGTDRLYFMYLHMSPKALRDAGMRRGELVRVRKGQVIGKVGNFEKAVAGGTSTHLHFEIRRGDSIGVPLSPYWTLVRAYERLIGGSGTELTNR